MNVTGERITKIVVREPPPRRIAGLFASPVALPLMALKFNSAKLITADAEQLAS